MMCDMIGELVAHIPAHSWAPEAMVVVRRWCAGDADYADLRHAVAIVAPEAGTGFGVESDAIDVVACLCRSAELITTNDIHSAADEAAECLDILDHYVASDRQADAIRASVDRLGYAIA